MSQFSPHETLGMFVYPVALGMTLLLGGGVTILSGTRRRAFNDAYKGALLGVTLCAILGLGVLLVQSKLDLLIQGLMLLTLALVLPLSYRGALRSSPGRRSGRTVAISWSAMLLLLITELICWSPAGNYLAPLTTLALAMSLIFVGLPGFERIGRRLIRLRRQRYDQADALVSAIAGADRLATLGAIAPDVGAAVTHTINEVDVDLSSAIAGVSDPKLLIPLERAEEALGLVRSLAGALEASEPREEVESVNLAESWFQASRLLESVIRHQAVRLSVSIPASLNIQIRRTELIQLLLNVLSNAINACDERAERNIAVAATATGPRVVLRISDTGQANARTLNRDAFLPFMSTKGEDNAGLGLAICRDIVQSLGGQIRFDDRTAQTTLVFDLPRAN